MTIWYCVWEVNIDPFFGFETVDNCETPCGMGFKLRAYGEKVFFLNVQNQ